MIDVALVTGFAGYGGRGRNPAGEAAKALDGRSIGGLEVKGRVLPVSYGRLQADLHDVMDELRRLIDAMRERQGRRRRADQESGIVR